MLIEMLFCIMFFILPLVGMLITLLINGFQVEHAQMSEQSTSKAYISSQKRAAQIRRVLIKIEDKYHNWFFNKWRNKYVKSQGFLDTS